MQMSIKIAQRALIRKQESQISYQRKEVPGIPQAQIWKHDSQSRKTKSRKISAFRDKERLKANQKKEQNTLRKLLLLRDYAFEECYSSVLPDCAQQILFMDLPDPPDPTKLEHGGTTRGKRDFFFFFKKGVQNRCLLSDLYFTAKILFSKQK